MSDVLLLLGAKWRSSVNGSRDRKEKTKAIAVSALAAAFCVGIYLAAHLVFQYIEDLNITGENLAIEKFLRFEINHRILAMAVMTFLAVLIFSNIITALTTFFLSDDLELIQALPALPDSVFLARFLETVFDSSWMIVIFGTPVFVAFGVVYHAPALYYLLIPATMLPFILIPAGLGTIVTMSLVYAFPARRIRDILLLLSVIAAGLLFVLFRFLQPEKLANPDATLEVIEFINTLQAPEKMWMPNYWLADVIKDGVDGGLASRGLEHLSLLWITALGMSALAMGVARLIYAESYSKSQEATRVIISRTSLMNRLISAVSAPFGTATRQMVMKDIRMFMRDTTQWSQLFLLAALVVIYVFNFRALQDMPIKRFGVDQMKLGNLLSYLNIGLAGFVLSALTARFTFPMVSQEGRAFWIVKTSPLSLKGFLWSKFLISVVPLILVGEVLIVLTNYILGVSHVVWVAGVVTIFFMTFGITGMGVGLGARFPKFTAENPAKVATSFGGVVYMVLTMAVIGAVVMLEATPTWIYFRSQWRNIPLTRGDLMMIFGSFALAFSLLLAATFIPMRVGLKWLQDLEL